jgi:hypothetical protein
MTEVTLVDFRARRRLERSVKGVLRTWNMFYLVQVSYYIMSSQNAVTFSLDANPNIKQFHHGDLESSDIADCEDR